MRAWPPPASYSSISRWVRIRRSCTSAGYHGLLEMVGAVSTTAGLPVMVSPGVVPDEMFWRATRPRCGVVCALPGDPYDGALRASASGAALQGAQRGAPRGAPRRPAGGRRSAHRHRRHRRRPRAFHQHDACGRLGASPRDDLRTAGRTPTGRRSAGRRRGGAAHHRGHAPRHAVCPHPGVARRGRHSRPGAAAQRRRQRGHVDRAPNRGARRRVAGRAGHR